MATSTLNNPGQGIIRVLSKGMNGIALTKIPAGYYGIVHSASGDPRIRDLGDYAESMVHRLVTQAKQMRATPLSMSNVIDSNKGDIAVLRNIFETVVYWSGIEKFAIVNGENGIIDRVEEASIVGTMLSIAPKYNYMKELGEKRSVRIIKGDDAYILFDPQDKLVYMNSDGNGTKPEMNERALMNAMMKNKKFIDKINISKKLREYNMFGKLVFDTVAMDADDAGKIGADIIAISAIAETRGNIPYWALWALGHQAKKITRKGIEYIIQREDVGNRIRGYKDDAPAINMNGTAVSLLDEKYINNPLKPYPGQHLIAIRSPRPTPRSNGLTNKRKIMREWLGDEWHNTSEGRHMLEYLVEPSTIFYFAFKELLDHELATSFYHMSGGAYDSKLARPLAKHDLYVSIDNLFPPDPREILLYQKSGSTLRDTYKKWPMGTEAFITTDNPDDAIAVLRSLVYDSRDVGTLESTGRKGLTLIAYDGENISFDGTGSD